MDPVRAFVDEARGFIRWSAAGEILDEDAARTALERLGQTAGDAVATLDPDAPDDVRAALVRTSELAPLVAIAGGLDSSIEALGAACVTVIRWWQA